MKARLHQAEVSVHGCNKGTFYCITPLQSTITAQTQMLVRKHQNPHFMFVRWAEESSASPPEEKERGRGRKTENRREKVRKCSTPVLKCDDFQRESGE